MKFKKCSITEGGILCRLFRDFLSKNNLEKSIPVFIERMKQRLIDKSDVKRLKLNNIDTDVVSTEMTWKLFLHMFRYLFNIDKLNFGIYVKLKTGKEATVTKIIDLKSKRLKKSDLDDDVILKEIWDELLNKLDIGLELKNNIDNFCNRMFKGKEISRKKSSIISDLKVNKMSWKTFIFLLVDIVNDIEKLKFTVTFKFGKKTHQSILEIA